MKHFTDKCWKACPTKSECSEREDGSGIKCTHKCEYLECGNYGQCELKDDEAVCRCNEAEDIEYSGVNCDIVKDKIPVSKQQILIISCSVVGFLLLIIIIVAILFYRRHRQFKTLTKSNRYLDDENVLERYSLYSGTAQEPESQRISSRSNDNVSFSHFKQNNYRRETSSHEHWHDVELQDEQIGHQFYIELHGITEKNRSKSYMNGAFNKYDSESAGSSQVLESSFNQRLNRERKTSTGDYIHRTTREISQKPLSVYGEIDTDTDFSIRRPKIIL
ncbi:hypothetical protein LOTGIDRAFT_239080 [Lottia gigantea]|uniref:EGF-like domain-containing protein n=1 Tax=Lottia gigantea TaxID=225164 RepID=V4C8R1_LOTGI|nr:hypothetical protein LOTGIDRAFT_239080 [Lottia gigantea]ESO98139.1 hypothetical protein LOTGIDRAFT_239080 [Lottia gigantea]